MRSLAILARVGADPRGSRRRLRPWRRLAVPERLEDRAVPGGSLLELLLGVPLATPFLGLTSADGNPEEALEPPGLNARRQEHLWALAELRSDSPLMDDVLDEVRRVLTISSAEAEVTE